MLNRVQWWNLDPFVSYLVFNCRERPVNKIHVTARQMGLPMRN